LLLGAEQRGYSAAVCRTVHGHASEQHALDHIQPHGFSALKLVMDHGHRQAGEQVHFQRVIGSMAQDRGLPSGKMSSSQIAARRSSACSSWRVIAIAVRLLRSRMRMPIGQRG
jgi:hypothetical protein